MQGMKADDRIEGDRRDEGRSSSGGSRRFGYRRAARSGPSCSHLIEGGDLTRYGLFNAITRTAEDLGRLRPGSTEFERIGRRS
jgi:hypothetical protein